MQKAWARVAREAGNETRGNVNAGFDKSPYRLDVLRFSAPFVHQRERLVGERLDTDKHAGATRPREQFGCFRIHLRSHERGPAKFQTFTHHSFREADESLGMTI